MRHDPPPPQQQQQHQLALVYETCGFAPQLKRRRRRRRGGLQKWDKTSAQALPCPVCVCGQKAEAGSESDSPREKKTNWTLEGEERPILLLLYCYYRIREWRGEKGQKSVDYGSGAFCGSFLFFRARGVTRHLAELRHWTPKLCPINCRKVFSSCAVSLWVVRFCSISSRCHLFERVLPVVFRRVVINTPFTCALIHFIPSLFGRH